MAWEAEQGEGAPFPNGSQTAKLGREEVGGRRQPGRGMPAPTPGVGSDWPGRGLLHMCNAPTDVHLRR